ncbi:hypothetical protein GCM10009555_016900 [Acrocarpospora macrocephala]
MTGDARARVWTRVGLAAAALIVLQVLLLTGALPFRFQVVPVSLSAVATMCWAGAIGAAGARTRTLPATVTRLGRIIVIGLLITAGALAIGAFVTVVFDVSWAWVAGGIPGAVSWALLPAWTLMLALNPVKSSPGAQSPEPAGTSTP